MNPIRNLPNDVIISAERCITLTSDHVVSNLQECLEDGVTEKEIRGRRQGKTIAAIEILLANLLFDNDDKHYLYLTNFAGQVRSVVSDNAKRLIERMNDTTLSCVWTGNTMAISLNGKPRIYFASLDNYEHVKHIHFDFAVKDLNETV